MMLMRGPGQKASPDLIELRVFPDSAVTLPGRPIALPEVKTPIDVFIGPAYRISRLGKCIERKFARRYIDAMSCGVVIMPRIVNSIAFDDAVTVGEWLDYAPEADIELGTADDDRRFLSTARDIDIEGAIELLTRNTTIKTGDIIIPALMMRGEVSDSRIEVKLNGLECLNKRII